MSNKPVLVQIAEENCRLLEERAAQINELTRERDDLQTLIDKFYKALDKGMPRGDEGAGHREVHMSVEAFDAFVALKQKSSIRQK